MRALILEEGRSLAGLAATRALGRAGWSVGIGAPISNGFAALSRYATASHYVPSPHDDVDGFVGAVNKAVREGRYEVCFGTGDPELVATSACRDAIDCIVPYASHEKVLRAIDKLELAVVAEQNGLTTPTTVQATNEAIDRIQGHAVVKPRLHWMWGTWLAPRLVSSRGDALQAAETIRAAGGEPIIQPWITGRLMSVAVVIDSDGDLLSAFQQISDEPGPSPLGGNVRARSVRLDRSLLARIAAFLSDLGWSGLAQLQFMVPDGGQPHLIDLNGRFYGSMALAIGAGVNLPATWAAMATSRPVVRNLEPTIGVRYRWLEGDLFRALKQEEGHRSRRVLASIWYRRGAVHPIADPNDRRPLLRYQSDVLQRAARKLARVPNRFLSSPSAKEPNAMLQEVGRDQSRRHEQSSHVNRDTE
jgi:predicted ATP-grasp superfamily ATP-dependent carboligase